jgi:uncharacterized protein
MTPNNEACATTEEGPQACLVVTRIVAPNKEDDLRRWIDGVGDAARAADGFVAMLRFRQTGGLSHNVFLFRSAADLDRWEGTRRYHQLMEDGDRFSTARRQRLDPGNGIAQLPAESDSPKWKRFLMTYAAVLPIVLVVNVALNALPQPLPALAQAVVSSLILVAAMTWAVLPFVSRRLKPWVVRDERGRARIER